MSKFLTPIRWRFILLLIFASGIYFFSNLHRVAIPGAVFDRLQSHFACPASGIAGLGAAFMYVYAVMQPLTGLLLDRFGSARVMIAGGAVFVSGLFCFANAHSIAAAYFAQILCGCGAGSIYLSIVKENIRVFRSHYNIALATIVLIGYAGGMFANAPMLMIIKRTSLSDTLQLNAVIALIFTVLVILLLLPGRWQAIHKERSFSPREFKLVFKLKHNCKLYTFSAINFALFYVLQTVIGKKFLQDFCSMSEISSGWVFTITGAMAACGGMAVAALSTLFNNRRRIFCRISGIVCSTVFALTLVMIMLNIHNAILYSTMFIVLAGTASLSSILIPLLRETNGTAMVGKTVSMLNFSFYTAVALFGNLAGGILKLFTPQERAGVLVYGQSTWCTLFALFFAASLLVLYFSFQMQETFGRSIADIDNRKQ